MKRKTNLFRSSATFVQFWKKFKHISLLVLTMALIANVFVGCDKDNNVQPTSNPPTDNNGTGGAKYGYNQSDTTISLQNGRVTLDIPAGAMRDSIQVSMKPSNVAFVDTASLLHQFQLLPEGTKFLKPVTLVFHCDSAWLKSNPPWDIGIAFRNDSDGKWYPAVNGIVDTLDQTISIKTTHFSYWSIYTCFHLYMKTGTQLSEDHAQIIRMSPGDKGLLLVSMDEPPAWTGDPDKSAGFSGPLLAELVKPPIDPKEPYHKALAPDQWAVDGIVKGDKQVGTISPVNGLEDHLFQYTAPPQAPEGNLVTISAAIRTIRHGLVIVKQPVEILGKWKIEYTDTTKLSTDGIKIFWTARNATFFHLDKNNHVVYDGESHSVLNFYKLVDPTITSWAIKTKNYLKVIDLNGKYDGRSNTLNCTLSMIPVPGTTTQTLCASGGCVTNTGDGKQFGVTPEKVHLMMKLNPGYTYRRDTTLVENNDGNVHIYESYSLEDNK